MTAAVVGVDEVACPVRVFMYARVSTQKQADRDLSIPDQLAAIEKYASARGWSVVGQYVDEGQSGTTDRRAAFQQMIEDALEGRADIIVVHSLSRLFREHFFMEKYRRKLDNKGIRITSITEDFGDNEAGLLMQQFVALMGEWQSKENAKHVTRTRIANAQRGNFNGGIPPFGYEPVKVGMSGDRERKRLGIKEQEAEIVRLIYRLRLEGDGETGPMGVVQIVNWLNSRGYRNRKGGVFYVNVVHRILKDEVYAGRYWSHRRIKRTGRVRPKSEWLLTEVPAIVTEEQFAKTQAVLASCRPSANPPRFQTSDVILGGLCWCATCGGSLCADYGKGKRYSYYCCSNRKKKGPVACPTGLRISRETLDQLVLSAVVEELLQPDRVCDIVARICELRASTARADGATLGQLKRNRGQLSGQLSNLIRAVAQGALSASDAVRKQQEQLETEMEKLDALIAVKLRASAESLLPISRLSADKVCKLLRQKILTAPPRVKRRYVQALVDRIEVSSTGDVFVNGSCEAVADLSRLPDPGNDNGLAQVRSSVRKWRWAQSWANRSLPSNSHFEGNLKGISSGFRARSRRMPPQLIGIAVRRARQILA